MATEIPVVIGVPVISAPQSPTQIIDEITNDMRKGLHRQETTIYICSFIHFLAFGIVFYIMPYVIPLPFVFLLFDILFFIYLRGAKKKVYAFDGSEESMKVILSSFKAAQRMTKAAYIFSLTMAILFGIAIIVATLVCVLYFLIYLYFVLIFVPTLSVGICICMLSYGTQKKIYFTWNVYVTKIEGYLEYFAAQNQNTITPPVVVVLPQDIKNEASV